MDNNIQILSLFPTPLFMTTLPNSLSSVIPWLDKQPMNPNSDSFKEYGRRSENSYILNNPSCKDLRTSILSNALEFSKTTLGYSYKEYTFSQSWISHKYPGESHHPHSHSNSLISGVFYYGKFSPDTPQIIFHETYTQPNSPSLSPSIENTIINQFNTPECHIKVSPGTLILFSSHFRHSVPKNNTKDIRKSLAFNIIPLDGFGDEAQLNELKFN